MGALALGAGLHAQTVYDITPIMKTELNGTARFVGMGGAMGALGGDITTMGTNPAGIGIYRSNDIGIASALCNKAAAAVDTTDKDGIYRTVIGTLFSLRLCLLGLNGRLHLLPGSKS